MKGIRRLVAISGCDSGLGWAVAARMSKAGHVVVAGMHEGLDTPAANSLRELEAHTVALDVTKPISIQGFKDYVKNLLNKNSEYRMHALVNNAGVLVTGEFEWLTPSMIEAQLSVNLVGAINLSHAFIPVLRSSTKKGYKYPRLINITSHCSLQPLPLYTVYSATKCGLLAWADALRMEIEPRGIKVVNYIPGSFFIQSRLMSRHKDQAEIMYKNFDEEQLSYYGKYFKILMSYLNQSLLENEGVGHDSLNNEAIIQTFLSAVSDENPKNLYKYEPWSYWLYFKMLQLPMPKDLKTYIIRKFLNFPKIEQ